MGGRAGAGAVQKEHGIGALAGCAAALVTVSLEYGLTEAPGTWWQQHVLCAFGGQHKKEDTATCSAVHVHLAAARELSWQAAWALLWHTGCNAACGSRLGSSKHTTSVCTTQVSPAAIAALQCMRGVHMHSGAMSRHTIGASRKYGSQLGLHRYLSMRYPKWCEKSMQHTVCIYLHGMTRSHSV